MDLQSNIIFLFLPIKINAQIDLITNGELPTVGSYLI